MDTNNALSVSEINELVKAIITENLDDTLYIKGEISNLKKSAGNVFFSLKDANSMVNAVFWRAKPGDYSNGDTVTISGKITTFPKQGTYQISIQTIEKCGIGDIYQKYDKLKQVMDRKSYFSKKREFPTRINRIAILTAMEGAALQDILYVLKENGFTGEIYVKNCFVQGVNCPNSVKEGIEYFNLLNESKPIDILVVARGGGSIEDLMGYSTEEVVKAIYLSDVFVISAIGHEIDTMLSDLAADFRAPTPSIAGETIIRAQKKRTHWLEMIGEKLGQMRYSIESSIVGYEAKIQNLESIHRSSRPENLIDNEIRRLEDLRKTMEERIVSNLNGVVHEIEKLKDKNSMHNTTKVLKAGYVIITNEQGDLIDSVVGIRQGGKMKIMFADGTVEGVFAPASYG